MKQKLISLLCVVLPLFMMAQQKDYSHWSVSGGLGINRYDGDVTQSVFKALPDAKGITNWTGGIEVEYAFTPVWGVSLDYYYIPYKGNFTDGKWGYGGFTFQTNTNNIDLNATINLMKLIFPELKTKWHVNTSVGIGPAFYKFKSLELTDAALPAYAAKEADILKEVSILYDDKGARISKDLFRGVTIPLTLSTEYNINKSLALGGKLQFRLYNQDDLEGFKFVDDVSGTSPTTVNGINAVRKPWRGVTNDMAEVLTIYARYKINAVNKDHLRNISMKEFTENEDLKKLRADVNGLKNKVNDIDGKVENLKPRVEKLEKTLADGPDDDGDGVPNHRDLEPNTPKLNEVDFYGRTVPGRVHVSDQAPSNVVTPDQLLDGKDSDGDGVPDSRDREPNTPKGNPVDFWGVTVTNGDVHGAASVYFDFDKVDLDAEALKAIKYVGEKMKADPSLTVEVRGYADFIGSIPYNKKLSQRRADVVKAKLMKDYGIAENRIIANGKGKLFEPKKAYRLNRRANFFFNK